VAVDPSDGTILVADSGNRRVQRFASDLSYLSEFPVPGWAGRNVYEKPYIAVGTDGTIYTTDPATFWVVTFDRNGQVQEAFGGQGAGLNQFGLPNGIEVDPAGSALLVADGGNSRVMVFQQ
jgi:DNA-binding beta-propeller fold protein YncE